MTDPKTYLPVELQKAWELCEKATPGPWEYRLEEDGTHYVGTGIYKLIERTWGTIEATTTAQRKANNAECEANAHLMAVAPLALSLLIKMVKEVEELTQTHNATIDLYQEWQAKAVMAELREMDAKKMLSAAEATIAELRDAFELQREAYATEATARSIEATERDALREALEAEKQEKFRALNRLHETMQIAGAALKQGGK